MKKLKVLIMVSVLMISLSLVSMAADDVDGELYLNAYFLMPGNISMEVFGMSGNIDTNEGFALGFEYYIDKINMLKYGIGAKYHLFLDDIGEEEELNFIPLYGVINYNLEESPISLIGKLGYNFMIASGLSSDESALGGLYYGAGIGFALNENIHIKGIYSINNGEFQIDDDDFSVSVPLKYSKISIGASLAF